MKRMYTGLSDKALVGGGSAAMLTGIINYFSPSEWMIIGIMIGAACTLIGCISGIYFRCRRERLLREWIKTRQIIAAAPVDEELEMLDRD